MTLNACFRDMLLLAGSKMGGSLNIYYQVVKIYRFFFLYLLSVKAAVAASTLVTYLNLTSLYSSY